MDTDEMATWVDQVVAGAELALGGTLDAAALERYAREAVLDLWSEQLKVTVHVAELALTQLRAAIERRPGMTIPTPTGLFPSAERAA